MDHPNSLQNTYLMGINNAGLIVGAHSPSLQVGGLRFQTAEQIFGPVDAVKFRSSMTLFSEVADREGVFVEALCKYFRGERDQLTLEKL